MQNNKKTAMQTTVQANMQPEASLEAQSEAPSEAPRPFNQQFTLRGVIIGIIGCAVITASSIYMALKLGALPWPIFFVVLVALFALKFMGRFGRSTNINEANVSATIMSAGAMVAGGLAFTVPGVYMLMPTAEIPLATIMICAICGVVLGCIGTALFRRQFVVQANLPFPIGRGAAETLKAGDKGGRRALLLFVATAFAGLFAVARDALHALPSMLFSWVKIPGVNFGVYFSLLPLAMGFMIAPLSALVWVAGGLLGDFGLVVGGTAAGLWDLATAQGFKMSLGIGGMIGCGLGIIIKMLLGVIKNFADKNKSAAASSDDAAAAPAAQDDAKTIVPLRWAPFAVAAVVLALCLGGGLGVLPAILLVALVWLVMTMAAQCTGQAGLNPMEVLGVIVLLVIALIAQTGGIEAFLVAAVATVACGFVGDLMNDFKAGHILNSNPRAQWIGEFIGGIVGAVVGALVLAILVGAYGAQAFGPNATGDTTFVAAQASAVASMIGGIPNLPAFIIGVVAGIVLYVAGAPVITLGLGIYLPFYLSLTVAVGAALRFIIGRIAPKWAQGEGGTILASGFLAGESITSVIIALIAVAGSLFG
jgi:putative OPT family oligopeptide transporter